MQGKVKFFKPERGYGFIKGDDYNDYFVHHSNISMDGFRFLERDQIVEFTPSSSEKGLNALNVEVLNNDFEE